MDPAPAGTVADEGITPAELRLAARNHGLPLEALRHDLTPVGLHYLLIHYDIPGVDPDAFRLEVDGAVEQPLASRSPIYRQETGWACRSHSNVRATDAPCSSRGR